MRLERSWEADVASMLPPKGGGGSNAGRPAVAKRGKVTTWSAKSRASLRWALAAMPWEELGGRPAMVTLTYPADWAAVAPNGPAVAGQFRAFRKRWARRWGEPVKGVWIREFQKRGAPHFHMYVGLPAGVSDGEYEALVARTMKRKRLEAEIGTFEARRKAGFLEGEFGKWLLAAWSEVVGGGPSHAKFGADVAPMFWGATVQEAAAGRVNWSRISHYLWRESGKWGQKTAPEGFEDPGRSWGTLGVELRASETELEPAEAMELRRVLYGVYRNKVQGRGRGRVRKPYRGRDGLVVYGVEREDARRMVRWARETSAWKAGLAPAGRTAADEGGGGRRSVGPLTVDTEEEYQGLLWERFGG